MLHYGIPSTIHPDTFEPACGRGGLLAEVTLDARSANCPRCGELRHPTRADKPAAKPGHRSRIAGASLADAFIASMGR